MKSIFRFRSIDGELWLPLKDARAYIVVSGPQKRQSCGVWGTKWLIRRLFPEAVAAFDPCAAQHDKDYKTVDWSKGACATAAIDQKFYQCCLTAAHGDALLEADARTFYRACRRWGKMRAALWKIGIRY